MDIKQKTESTSSYFMAQGAFDNGYLILPLKPRSKYPDLETGEKAGAKDRNNNPPKYDFTKQGPYRREVAAKKLKTWSPMQGVGVFLGGEHRLCALDCDVELSTLLKDYEPELAAKLYSVIETFNKKWHNEIYSTTVCRGKKGYKAFFRREKADYRKKQITLPSQLRVDKEPVFIELLMGGCKDKLGSAGYAVIPPSFHPVTKKPYVYLSDKTLSNTPIQDLPLFTEEMEASFDAIEAELVALLPEDLQKKKPVKKSKNQA